VEIRQKDHLVLQRKFLNEDFMGAVRYLLGFP
jgi:hypothetical protein